MAVVGFALHRILTERLKEFTGRVTVRSKADITNIEKSRAKIVAPGKDILKVNFNFSITYEPKFAIVDFKGHTLTLEDQKQAKKILRDWEKEKKVDPELKEKVFNVILRKCNVKALEIEEDMNLPPHIPLPRVTRRPPTGAPTGVG